MPMHEDKIFYYELFSHKCPLVIFTQTIVASYITILLQLKNKVKIGYTTNRGRFRGPVPPLKIVYLLHATINSMKITLSGV